MTLKGRPYCFHNGFPAVSGRPGDGHWEPVVGHCTNGLVHTQWKSGMSEVGYGSTVTWPVNSRALLTLGIPESKVGMLVWPEHSHWLAQTEREMTQVRLSVVWSCRCRKVHFHKPGRMQCRWQIKGPLFYVWFVIGGNAVAWHMAVCGGEDRSWVEVAVGYRHHSIYYNNVSFVIRETKTPPT